MSFQGFELQDSLTSAKVIMNPMEDVRVAFGEKTLSRLSQEQWPKSELECI